ncbi:hypothetical protein SAY86_011968 [Trapa natans]|uniref:NAC domain-containing protein n=1 Tax=Trapa natans TaxID=22666 RepID=A0AAN7LXB1_TRANT|nr:hypothetical protein SAY86_011968 [Trapa natans]
MEENLPPGFRFHPTDEELITCYLTRKATDVSFISKVIADVDLNKCEPWDLPDKASMGEKERYFFSMRDRKYPTGLRTNRATQSGYWKTTGKDKEILGGAGHLVGMKKTLVFYHGRAPRGEKSNWVMHEYRLENKPALKNIKDEWVVCRVFQKRTSMKIVKPEEQLSMDSPCDTAPSEYTDIDFQSPNLVNSSHYVNNISVLPNQPLTSIDNNNALHSYLNENNNLAWEATRGLAGAVAADQPQPQLPWPSSFLSSTNLAINSLILKVLQLKSDAAMNSSDYGHHHQQALLQAHQFSTAGGIDMGTSSFNNLGPCSISKQQQQQQGGDHQPQQEQPMNWDPFNEGK